MRIAKLGASLRQADSTYSALCECWTGTWKRQRSQKVAHWASPSEPSLRRIRGDGGICKLKQFYDLERRLGANIKPLGNALRITMSRHLPQSQRDRPTNISCRQRMCVHDTKLWTNGLLRIRVLVLRSLVCRTLFFGLESVGAKENTAGGDGQSSCAFQCRA